jgi:hypothetical protein
MEAASFSKTIYYYTQSHWAEDLNLHAQFVNENYKVM